MKKSTLLNSLILAALAVPGLALAEDSPFSGNVSLTSNYLYRGVSQTNDKAAIQGGFDYAHPSGFYAGAWGSSISWLVDGGYYNSSSLELDTYAGFKGGFAEDFTFDVGFLRYNYPGEYLPPQIAANTNEIYGAIGWKWLTAKYSRSMTNLFGVDNSSGSGYIDLSGSYTLEGPGVTLGAHDGKQIIANTTPSGDYTDYNVKASKDFSGFTLAVLLSKVKGSIAGIYDEDTKGVLSVSYSM